MAVVLFGLGCTPDGFTPIPSQRWQGVDVQIEVRPSPPIPGMNEVWVILTDERKRPVFDAIVSVRATASKDWQQGIQDGHTGVFRRAIRIVEPQRQKIEVKLNRRGTEGVLEFPVVSPAAVRLEEYTLRASATPPTVPRPWCKPIPTA